MIVNRVVGRIEIPRQERNSFSEKIPARTARESEPANRITCRIESMFSKTMQNINKFTESIQNQPSTPEPASPPRASSPEIPNTATALVLGEIKPEVSEKDPAQEEIPSPAPRPRISRQEIDRLIKKVASRHNLSAGLIRAVALAESGLDPHAESDRGALGLMQLMPETARELGVEDPLEPLQNLDGGSRYLKRLLVKYGGDLEQALAAYNWGQGRLDRLGWDKIPPETSAFISRVMAFNKTRG